MKKYGHVYPACKEGAHGVLPTFSFTDLASWQEIPTILQKTILPQDSITPIGRSLFCIHYYTVRCPRNNMSLKKCCALFRLFWGHRIHSAKIHSIEFEILNMSNLKSFPNQEKIQFVCFLDPIFAQISISSRLFFLYFQFKI